MACLNGKKVLFGTKLVVGDAAGYNSGYTAGHEAGYSEGSTSGYTEGYAEGEAAGHEAGYAEGEAVGRKAQYDAFWDDYQNNGKHTKYRQAFSGYMWNAKTLRPKYDLIPTDATQMFLNFCNGLTYKKLDLVAHLEECGIILDFSSCETFTQVFGYSFFSRIGTVSFLAAKTLVSAFHGCDAKTIEKIVSNDSTPYVSSTFHSCTKLENIIFEGSIGTSINFQWSTLLSYDSFVSIINALSTTASGMTATFSVDAVNSAFETSEGAADGSTSAEWLELVATKKNWTIVLAE